MKNRIYKVRVQGGQIRLPETVHVQDGTKVFVVVPDTDSISVSSFTVIAAEDGLPIIRVEAGVITSQIVRDLEAGLDI